MSDEVADRLRIVPPLVERFRAYLETHGAWGSLHVALEDGNVDDTSVRWCKAWACKEGDTEGEALADVLLTMTKTQRLKIAQRAGEQQYERDRKRWER